MATGGLPAKPATREELEAFVAQNRRWLPDDAEQILRNMSPIDQKRVIGAGTMSSVRDPTAVIQARVRKAREMEAQIGRGGGIGPSPLLGEESRISKPATREELDSFIKSNERWLQGEAADILRAMSPVDQKRVISAGTMSGCRDPIAVIQTRAKKAREMELELESIAAGNRPPQQPEPPQLPPPPHFCEAAAAMHLFAPPELVLRQESKFAPPPESAKDGPMLIGDDRGIGGVIEILKAKYGCGKGQRLRVIGETPALLQFEGGKTAPKNQEDKGWKWVMREEEETRLAAERELEKARAEEDAKRAVEVAAKKAEEMAKRMAQATNKREKKGKDASDKPAVDKEAAKQAEEKPRPRSSSATKKDKDAKPSPKDEEVEKAKENTKDKDKRSRKDSDDEAERRKGKEKERDKSADKRKRRRDDSDDKGRRKKKARDSSSDSSSSRAKSKERRKEKDRRADDKKKATDSGKKSTRRDSSDDSDRPKNKATDKTKDRKRKADSDDEKDIPTEKDADKDRASNRKKAHYGSDDAKAKENEKEKDEKSKGDKSEPEKKDSTRVTKGGDKSKEKDKAEEKKPAPKKSAEKARAAAAAAAAPAAHPVHRAEALSLAWAPSPRFRPLNNAELAEADFNTISLAPVSMGPRSRAAALGSLGSASCGAWQPFGTGAVTTGRRPAALRPLLREFWGSATSVKPAGWRAPTGGRASSSSPAGRGRGAVQLHLGRQGAADTVAATADGGRQSKEDPEAQGSTAHVSALGPGNETKLRRRPSGPVALPE
eukprot:CAMPEP_0168373920 /NCGR_PEP_ID=MMETSP0228-20121227/9035_1 /TAXON_ID=133427 /ORGANISM="Protoceratium reticulatum, Strain CCCM 535 (=CCMP 1889)" /LENGTH=774 /DNA_ID=CAMNT_0008386853 /DNA_START=51 /DNA_END=2375 /DNA_ORIENTATION=-